MKAFNNKARYPKSKSINYYAPHNASQHKPPPNFDCATDRSLVSMIANCKYLVFSISPDNR